MFLGDLIDNLRRQFYFTEVCFFLLLCGIFPTTRMGHATVGCCSRRREVIFVPRRAQGFLFFHFSAVYFPPSLARRS